MTCIPSRGMFAPLSSLGLAVHLRGKCSSLDPHLCSPVPAAGGIAAGPLFVQTAALARARRRLRRNGLDSCAATCAVAIAASLFALMVSRC